MMRTSMSGRGGRITGGQTHQVHIGSTSEKPYKKNRIPKFIYVIPLAISVTVVLLLAFTDLDAWLAEQSSVFEMLFYELAYRDVATFFILLVSFFLGILCVCFIMYRLVSKHKGETDVSFHTYIDSEFYSSFDTLSSKLSAEDRIYFESQKRIKDNPNNMSEINMNHLDNMKKDRGDNDSHAQNKVETVGEDKVLDHSNRNEYNSVLDDLPEFDPDGPNPFGKS